MKLAESVGAHMSEANVKPAPAGGRKPFGQPLFVIE